MPIGVAELFGDPDRPEILETTALGAAWLAGQAVGIWPDQAGFAESWALEKRFEPKMDAETRSQKLEGWRRGRKDIELGRAPHRTSAARTKAGQEPKTGAYPPP